MDARKDCAYLVRGISGRKKWAKKFAHRLARRRAIALITERCSECGTGLDHNRSCPVCSDEAA